MSYSILASAPGSLMLFGEYAVLSGAPAIIFAIDRYIHVKLIPRSDDRIIIHSILGKIETSLQSLQISSPFEFVLSCFNEVKDELKTGCNLYIDAEFSSKLGLGSSAAVTVTTQKVINQWLNRKVSAGELWEQCHRIILKVQGKGSGADLAASIFGGLIYFKKGCSKNLEVRAFENFPPLCVVYSGQKAKTPLAISKVNDHLAFENFKKSMSHFTEQAIFSLENCDWKTLGSLCNQTQQVMCDLRISTPTLDTIAQALQQQLFGAKISGAGFGDCVIGIGELKSDFFLQALQKENPNVRILPVNISPALK